MAKQRRKVTMPAAIRNKMMAAVSMLLVSSIMMVSSTYAWFTLSTAPEVKNISTTVAGNGSLEIALMPTSGLLKDIKSGFSSDTANGGTATTVASNVTWGNIINLSDTSYGLNSVNLNPASLNVDSTNTTAFASASNPLAIASYGYDGRIETINANTVLKNCVDGAFNGSGYGVRAIGEDDGTGKLGSTYGYAIDLALRLNAQNTTTTDGVTSTSAGKLLLQTAAKQRIYSGDTSNGLSTNTETLGGGSYMSIDASSLGMSETTVKALMSSIRVTFVQDYGLQAVAGETAPTPIILGHARLDMQEASVGASNIQAPLYLYNVTSTTSTGTDGTTTTEVSATKLTGNDAVLLSTMEKNTAKQITAIVWLDGEYVKNENVSAVNKAFAQATLNLQFSTDVQLIPANNNALFKGNAS